MNGLMEQKQGPRSVGSNDEKLGIMDNSRAIDRYTPPPHHEGRKQSVASESNTSCSSRLQVTAYSKRRGSYFDDISSLASTDSSDESCTSENETILKRRRKLTGKRTKTYTHTNMEPPKQCDVGKYMAAREMTPFQERMNALTVLPSASYCIIFFLSGFWLKKSFIETYAQKMVNGTDFDDSQCLNSSWLPHVHALPPLPSLAVAMGMLSHAPFSMIYHWKYAHRLPPGLPRTTHWSRRMDQAMIHCQSAFFSYATSGRIDFFLANVLFNMDCFYRLFLDEVRPKRNQIRIGISIIAYSTPLLMRGEFMALLKLAFLLSLSGWLFCHYPIGGWSHSVFHIVLTFIPPIIIASALDISSSQTQLEVAAHCAILAENA